jgi:hypothetical protein
VGAVFFRISGGRRSFHYIYIGRYENLQRGKRLIERTEQVSCKGFAILDLSR